MYNCLNFCWVLLVFLLYKTKYIENKGINAFCLFSPVPPDIIA